MVNIPEHPYNDPRLSPKGFLMAVMRDRTVLLSHRIQAATYLMPLTEHPLRCVREPEYTVKIEPQILQ
jgi:hypothetical protein